MGFLSKALQRIAWRVVWKGAFEDTVLDGDLGLSYRSGQLQRLDTNGAARTITLPGLARVDEGYFFVLGAAGDDGETITVEDAGGATVVELEDGELAVVYASAGTWRVFAKANLFVPAEG